MIEIGKLERLALNILITVGYTHKSMYLNVHWFRQSLPKLNEHTQIYSYLRSKTKLNSKLFYETVHNSREAMNV